ncbi:MAG: hypothetical protein U0457_01440 [Candidatus Sericytochromatia bacterium]
MKKILILTLILSSCATVPTIKQNNEVKKDIQEIKVIEKDGKAKLNGEGVPENTISTPTTIPTQTPFVPSKEVIYLPTNEQQIVNAQKPRPNFAINYPYIEEKTKGVINIIFKDEFQIRYFSYKTGFVSKIGENLKFLNDLIVNKKIEFYSGTDMSNPKDEMGNYVTEEILEKKALEDKINSEKVTGDGYYSPNRLSFYKVVFKDITLKEILEPLRKEKYILSSNFDSDIYNTSNSSNTTNNNSIPIPTSSGYSCAVCENDPNLKGI